MQKTTKFSSGFVILMCLIVFLFCLNQRLIQAAVLQSDDFEDGNSTGWSTSGGSWSVVSDGTMVYKQSSTSANAYSYTGLSTWNDYSIQARVKPLSFNGTARSIGICARFQSTSNFYFVTLSNANRLELGKKVSGGTTSLASKTYSAQLGTWYTLKLVVTGTSLQAYVNGVQELTATDSSFSTGKVGVMALYTSGEFDDIVVDGNGPALTPTPTVRVTPTPTSRQSLTLTPTPTTAMTPTPTRRNTPTPTATPLPSATPFPTVTATPIPTQVTGAYYVAPSGNDANPGTQSQPFYTISKAVAVAGAPGSTIYVRGGTYNYTATITLASSGTSSAPIKILAYPGEQPIMNFSGMTYTTQDERALLRGFLLTGNYWQIKGLEICYAADNGIKIEGNYNTIEQCVFHHNKDSGLQIGQAKESTNPGGALVTNNRVINCDSYRNFDEYTAGGNADGFACKLYPGVGNYFYGCRAWENSDDGFDFYHTEYRITVEYCWTWHNGEQAIFGYTGSWSGNGQGFKLGDGTAPHLIKNSVAFDHKYTDGNNKGFDQNSNEGPVTVLNCTGWDNEINFYFGSGHAANVLKNNVGFAPTVKNISIVAESEQTNNCWNLTGIITDYADFVSLAPELAKAPRNSDGSLPNNGFARLVTSSDLIDKGVNVGIPFLGAAPDLGAYECR